MSRLFSAIRQAAHRIKRRHQRRSVSALLRPTTFSAQFQSDAAFARDYLPRLEKNLIENIAGFWYPRCLDLANGGYTINAGPQGQAQGPGTKAIVSQSRTVWFFARMARAGYRSEEYLAAADHGYRFLRAKLWDARHGGFFWEVDAVGDHPLRRGKHLYGQAFALYALSEYYLAGGQREVLDFAVALFDLIEAKAHDRKYGGYVEFFAEDWSAAPTDEAPYVGGGTGFKLMNTHLHLLEAITTFYRAGQLSSARERLAELLSIASSAVIRKRLGAGTDNYERDWTPRLDQHYAQVSYGHDLENIWLSIDACDALGVSPYPFLDLYRTLFDYALKYGFDARRGGFYHTGPPNRRATDRNKIWWVQAETSVSALYLYRLTGEEKYRATFAKTYDFIERQQVDWQYGEWHHTITPGGQARGDKASVWKSPYHNSRAMLECLQLLRQLARAGGERP